MSYNNPMATRVKICGVTTVDDARMCVDLGADAIGLNFYARSPRCIDEAAAERILTALPETVIPVALAVDEPWDASLARMKRLPRLRWIQVHSKDMTTCPAAMSWVPAFPVKDEASVSALHAFLDRCRSERKTPPTAVLIDAQVPGSFGGTGRIAPWELLAGVDFGVPLILAGGLTPDNVADAIRTVRPWMVDVASGVESSPGRKDRVKVQRFIDAVRSVGNGKG